MAENDMQGEWTLPDGWVWTTIGGITEPVEKVKPRDNPDEHFTYLDISSIDNKSNRVAEPKVYYGAKAPSRARQMVQENDVLFSTVRTYLKNIALVPEAYDGQIASTGFSILRGEPGISSKYAHPRPAGEGADERQGKARREADAAADGVRSDHDTHITGDVWRKTNLWTYGSWTTSIRRRVSSPCPSC